MIDEPVTYRFFENNAAARRRVAELLQPAGAATNRIVNKALIRPMLHLKGNVSMIKVHYLTGLSGPAGLQNPDPFHARDGTVSAWSPTGAVPRTGDGVDKVVYTE